VLKPFSGRGGGKLEQLAIFRSKERKERRCDNLGWKGEDFFSDLGEHDSGSGGRGGSTQHLWHRQGGRGPRKKKKTSAHSVCRVQRCESKPNRAQGRGEKLSDLKFLSGYRGGKDQFSTEEGGKPHLARREEGGALSRPATTSVFGKVGSPLFPSEFRGKEKKGAFFRAGRS